MKGYADLKEYKVWDKTTRWFHWINVLSVLGLIAVGTVILYNKKLGISVDGKILLTDVTERLLEKVKRVRAVFAPGQVPEKIECGGLLRMRREEREAVLTVTEFDGGRALDEIKRHSPTSVTVESLTLEDIFVEFLPEQRDDQ